MIVQMDKMSAPSRELAQRLYEKNIELDSRRRKSAQARVPSDPSIWQQMRENYESIILEDHAFSEKHNIEHALWQLHYKKIEELRAHYGAAQASAQGAKGPPRPDRITKIRLQFKTFLSEASGFYHDLIMKIRGKYGLPLGYFSDDSENRIVMEKDIKKSSEMKKGLISCHRCLIYLGDLARYKGLYGEANSRTREYAAASSYYLQAASIWPSIGNPHHQLAILASYTGDEFLTVYRYFRSLAVENPCSTARDNLIVAFEKNRQSYTQQLGDVKASVVRLADKGRGQKDKSATKDSQKEVGALKENTSSPHDVYRSFCTRFVRLNGILFTKTSLETFSEVLSHVNKGLLELLSSGPDEELHFGANASENELFFIRLVAILIFTVHSTKRENDGQSYAEIVQRAVLLQNAYSAAFDILAHLLERCEQLRDPSTSYLLPGVLVFLEWLACSPDVAAGSDADEKQIKCRTNFWTRFISLINRLLISGSIAIEDNEDETCFFNMSRYDGENENRLALSEDFELRGFLPLVPAHTILDFSAKRAFGSDGSKERSDRVKRILAAGKALFSLIKIDQKKVNYDPKGRKFIAGFEHPQIVDNLAPSVDQVVSKVKEMRVNDEPEKKALKSGVHLQNSLLHVEGEDDDDEEIVFRPPVAEKQRDFDAPLIQPYEVLEPSKSTHIMYGSSVARPLGNVMQMDNIVSNGILPASAPVQNVTPQHMQQMQVPSRWLMEEESSFAKSLKDMGVMENGHGLRPEVQNFSNFHPASAAFLDSTPQPPVAVSSSAMFYSQTKAPEPPVFSQLRTMPLITSASGVVTDGMTVRTSSSALHPQVGPRRSPVSRPIRHAGPPPGFGPVPKQQVVNGHTSSATVLTSENPLMDDYSWLDGYQMPPAMKNLGLSSSNSSSSINSVTYPSHFHASSPQLSGGLPPGVVGFPFPGKRMGSVQSSQVDLERGLQNYQSLDYLRRQHEEQQMLLQQSQSNMVNNGNYRASPPPQAEQQQYQGSPGTGRYFV